MKVNRPPTQPLSPPVFRALTLAVLCVPPLGAQDWLQRQQAEDGRWPAAPSGGRAVRDLRATALVSLGLLADGSTLRSGPHRAELKHANAWMRAQQDDKGRLWLQTEPDWILDHAIAACAVAEAARLSDYTRPHLLVNVRSALGYLTEHLRHLQPGQAEAELLVWSAMTAHAAARWTADATKPDATAQATGATELLAEVTRLRPQAVPVQLRHRAAALLLGQLVPGGPPRDELIEPFAAAGWPEDMDDPLAVFYAGCALYRDSERNKGRWQTFGRQLGRLLVKTQDNTLEFGNSWQPQGAFGADGGRVCTSAVHVLILQLHYRYSQLAVAS